MKAGLATARAKGKKLGRPPLPPETVAKIKRLRAQGVSIRKIAEKLSVGTRQVREKTQRL